jgi:hypothetical protein
MEYLIITGIVLVAMVLVLGLFWVTIPGKQE